MGDNEKTTTVWRGKTLGKGARVSLFALGSLVLLAAMAAIYLGHDGAAVVAMLVIAGAALFLSIVGALPYRVTLGDKYTLEMGEKHVIQDAVDTVLSLLPAGSRGDSVESLISPNSMEGGPVEGVVASRITEHVVFSRRVLQVLTNTAERYGGKVSVEVDRGAWDILLTASDIRIYVDYRLQLDSAALRSLTLRAVELPEDSHAIVVYKYRTAEARNLDVAVDKAVAYVEWSGDGAELERCVSDIIADK